MEIAEVDLRQRVALLTDGRMSGASGKVLAAIHVTPEAADGGALAKLREGDLVRIDAEAGSMDVLVDAAEWQAREVVLPELAGNQSGMGRELFAACGSAKELLTVPGAQHGVSYFTDEGGYERRVFDFIARSGGRSGEPPRGAPG